MYCQYCGTELPDAANYCLTCGKPRRQPVVAEGQPAYEVCTFKVVREFFLLSTVAFVVEGKQVTVPRGDHRDLMKDAAQLVAEGWEPVSWDDRGLPLVLRRPKRR